MTKRKLIGCPVIQYQTHVFKFSCDSSGNAVFTHVSDTAEKNAYILGVGHGTTTSLNGQEGTGLLWTSDVEGQNLRIYDPIPPAGGGNLALLNAFNVPGVTKFTRPVFGDGRVYMGETKAFRRGCMQKILMYYQELRLAISMALVRLSTSR